ncbi:MAG: flagellar basal body L-ring protein FlgH [Spirochaetales bacterium]|nr:flagellar basal body L-ring protein FlgH [Spirochaetales bacterium]
MKQLLFGLTVCFFLSGTAIADSLWEENFNGYIAGSSTLRAGDIVTIIIDSGFSFQFTSSSKDTKSITFEFAGGEYGNLFSFLPTGRSGQDMSLRGGDSYTLEAEISARITQVDQFGKLILLGNKVVQFEGKQETITFSGRIDPKVVDANKQVDFSKVENARLIFTSFLTPAADTITQADIEEVVEEITAPDGTVTEKRTTRIRDERKRQLILLYLNRISDIVFQ